MPMRGRARAWWLRVHRVLGLGLGVWWVLVGLTGSALVFYPDLDAWLNPQIRPRAQALLPPSPQAVLEQVQALHPERTGPWRIEMPMHPDWPITVRYYQPQERAGAFFAPLMLTLDPLTLEPTSTRFWGDYAVTWLYDLHYTLLLGGTGRSLVGALGLLGAVSLLTGLALWWPSRARAWAALAPRLRAGAVRWHYDLHALAGVYSALLLLVLAITGTALAWPQTSAAVLGVQAHPRVLIAPASWQAGAPLLGLDAAVQIGQQQFAGAELRWIESAGEATTAALARPVVLRLYQAGEPGRRFPKTQLWLHPQSGEVLARHDALQHSAAEGVHQWLHPLHNGEALGLWGRALVCALGLVPAVLFWTGLHRWRVKRNAHRRASLKTPRVSAKQTR